MGVHQTVLLLSVIYFFYLQNAEIFGVPQRVPIGTIMLITDAKKMFCCKIFNQTSMPS